MSFLKNIKSKFNLSKAKKASPEAASTSASENSETLDSESVLNEQSIATEASNGAEKIANETNNIAEGNDNATPSGTKPETLQTDAQSSLTSPTGDADGKSSDIKPARKAKIKRFDQYIIGKFLGTFFFSILLLLAIIIIFDINEKLDAMLTAPLSATIFQYFLNFLPYFINQFAPLFTFIAVIFFTSKLADHSEIIAILSSGISFKRLTIPYLVSAAIIATLSFVLAAYVIPPANVQRIAYTNRWVKNKKIETGDNILLQVKPGVLAYIARYDNTTRTGYRFALENYDGKTMKSRLTANMVKYDTLGRWTLNDYEQHDFNGMRETMHKGQSLDTLLNVGPRDFLISNNDEQTLTSPALKEYINRQKARGVANIKNFEIEYATRFANTAAAFILTIIGLSLSSRKVRGGMGVNIGIGLVLSFSYILFMTVTSAFTVSGYTSATVAMWIPNMVYMIIAIFLFRKASK